MEAMYQESDYSKPLGTIRGSFTGYRRGTRGGFEIVLLVEDEDKHAAMDLVDGDFTIMLRCFGVPR
jgi:hypothetical protein